MDKYVVAGRLAAAISEQTRLEKEVNRLRAERDTWRIEAETLRRLGMRSPQEAELRERTNTELERSTATIRKLIAELEEVNAERDQLRAGVLPCPTCKGCGVVGSEPLLLHCRTCGGRGTIGPRR